MAIDTQPLTPQREKEIKETLEIPNSDEQIDENQYCKNFTSFLNENKELIDETLNSLDKGHGH